MGGCSAKLVPSPPAVLLGLEPFLRAFLLYERAYAVAISVFCMEAKPPDVFLNLSGMVRRSYLRVSL
jgi:hypothetical protein